jgi:hypothetical protein
MIKNLLMRSCRFSRGESRASFCLYVICESADAEEGASTEQCTITTTYDPDHLYGNESLLRGRLAWKRL